MTDSMIIAYCSETGRGFTQTEINELHKVCSYQYSVKNLCS